MVPVPAERTFLSVRWDTLASHTIERDPRDVFNASAVFVRGDTVDVTDGMSNRVLTIAPNGARTYRFTPPAPAPRRRLAGAAQLLPNGELLVLDAGTPRLFLVPPSEREARTVPLPSATPTQVVATADSGFLFFDLRKDSSLVAISRTGAVKATRPLPWPGVDTIPRLARQVWLTQLPTGGWAAAFAMGSGIMIARGVGDTVIRTHLVERVNFPSTRTRKEKGRSLNGFASFYGCTVCALAADSQYLYALVGTVPKERGRLVDRYELTSGRYAGSLLLPHKVSTLAINGNRLVGVQGTSPSVVTVLKFTSTASARTARVGVTP